MQVKVKKLHPSATLPKYATDGSGCFDLRACTVDDALHVPSYIEHDRPVACGTGLAFEIPQGHVMLIFSRSGHAFKDGIRLANCVGVIDSDYRGEVKVKLVKDDDWHDHLEHNKPPLIGPGDRVAQGLIVPIPRVEFVEADELSSTARGEGGFGSTGAA